MNSTLINKKEFFFSLLRLENSTQYSTSRLRFWFDHIRNNALEEVKFMQKLDENRTEIVDKTVILKKLLTRV